MPCNAATDNAGERRDARDTRQDTRQDGRKEKVDCRQADQKNNSECRQEYRGDKRDGREQARDIREYPGEWFPLKRLFALHGAAGSNTVSERYWNRK